ncbi:complement C1s subcomponent isoform X2 [Pseudophryne corroboree]|uniref:complement C1s subcomponent isoform X2 n=1 Tax=Pseudophryne corroboree TaxID=495146 RepID=UPI0030815FA5
MEIRWLFLLLLGYASAGSPSMFGEITSPNYPQGYPINANEAWEIQVPEGYGIRLYFIHLDIELSENCEYDSVKVIIGGEVQQVLCGRHLPAYPGTPIEDKYYPTTHLKLVFQSDFSNQERYTGFSAYYMAVDVDECEDDTYDPCSHFCNNYIGGFFCSCPPEYDLHADQRTCGVNCSGALYTDLKGQISSPGYPAPYPENSRCEYKVLLEPGYQVILTFQAEDFDIEAAEDGSCSYDSLTIKAKGRSFGPFCGKTPPSLLQTESNEVDIFFQTDSGGDHRGWKIRYSEDAIPCPTKVVDHAVLHPRQDKYVFKDSVSVSCVKGYEVLEGQKKLPSFQARCQGDGTWTNTHLECIPVDCGSPEKIENGAATFTHSTYESEMKYRCSTEYYTLSGNDTYRCSVDGIWRNNNGESKLPDCVPVCGISSLEHQSKIFGGSAAKEGDFPWVVHIVSDTKGGGALISDRWILTAAHVVQNGVKPSIKVGSWRLGHAKELQSKRVILHSKWIVEDLDPKRKTNYDNDIALIQLSNKVELGPCLYPVCLPQKGGRNSPAVGEVGYVAGWGITEKKSEIRWLQYAAVVFRDTDECRKTVVTDQAFTTNMMCAGGSGKDSCAGDSGGPLMFKDLTNPTDINKLYISGIVSWGIECGKFGMYTKVENYLDWIKETIEKVEKEEDEMNTEPVNICPEKKA